MVKILGVDFSGDAISKVSQSLDHDYIDRLRKLVGTKMVGMKILGTMLAFMSPLMIGVVLAVFGFVDAYLFEYWGGYSVSDMVWAYIRVILGGVVCPMISIIMIVVISKWSADKFRAMEVWRINIRNASCSNSAQLDLISRTSDIIELRKQEETDFPEGYGLYLQDEIQAMRAGSTPDHIQKRLDKHIEDFRRPESEKKIRTALKMERSSRQKWLIRIAWAAMILGIIGGILITLRFFGFDLLGYIISLILTALGMSPAAMTRDTPDIRRDAPMDDTPKPKERRNDTVDMSPADRMMELVTHDLAALDLSTEIGKQNYIAALTNLDASNKQLAEVVTQMGMKAWPDRAQQAMQIAKRLKPSSNLGLVPVWFRDIRDITFVFVFPSNKSSSLGSGETTTVMTPDQLWTAEVLMYPLGGILIDVYELRDPLTGQLKDVAVVQITYCAFLDQATSHALCLFDFGYPNFGATIGTEAKEALAKKKEAKKQAKAAGAIIDDEEEYGAAEYLKDIRTSTDSFVSNRLVVFLHKALSAYKELWPMFVHFLYEEKAIRDETAASIVEEQNDLGKGWGKSTRDPLLKGVPTWFLALFLFMILALAGVVAMLIIFMSANGGGVQ